MVSNKCGTCSTVKSISPKGHKYCKTCTKNYRIKHADRIKKYLAAHRNSTREENVAYQHTYRLKNREALLLKKKIKYDKEHPVKKPVYKNGHVSKHPDYAIWNHIRSRCENVNNQSYMYYGAKGVKVCDRWRESFDNFIEDMGPRPEPRKLYTIDRFPNKEGNYEPGNCRWATMREQNTNRNKRRPDAEVAADKLRIRRLRDRKSSAIHWKDNVSDSSPIFLEDGTETNLLQFSSQYSIPLDVCKYRYSQHPFCIDWIISTSDDSRHYEYKGHKFNMEELCLLSGQTYQTMVTRIKTFRWDIKRAIEAD